MVDLNDYFYFVHVVDKQGFSQAARALDMPKSRLSRHVAKLEERLDIKLIQRTSRQFNVTESGKVFYRHALSVLEEAEAAEAAIRQKKITLSGRVSMSCSVGVAQYALKGLIVQFLKDNPKVELQQQATNQPIDLVASGVDLAIRGHMDTLPDSSYIQRHLATVPWGLFTSPGYLQEHGIPQSPEDLYKQKALKSGWQPAIGHWGLQNTQGLKVSIPFTPQLSSDDIGTVIDAAVNGLGIISLPAYTCRAELSNGRLVRVLPEWTSGHAQLSLITPSRRNSSASVKALCDFLLANINKEIGD